MYKDASAKLKEAEQQLGLAKEKERQQLEEQKRKEREEEDRLLKQREEEEKKERERKAQEEAERQKAKQEQEEAKRLKLEKEENLMKPKPRFKSEYRRICFVIMPFSETANNHTKEYWTDHFNNYLKPLIEANPNLEARRSDSEPFQGDILKKIITDLVVSPLVVADLTDNNINVYYELGVRQSFKHGTITIAEEGTEIPFDIIVKNTLLYNPKDHLKMQRFGQQFTEAIQDCLNYNKPDSHVLETLSGRGTLFEIFNRDETIRRLKAILSECNRNLQVLKAVTDQAQTNLQNNKKSLILVDRFRAYPKSQ